MNELTIDHAETFPKLENAPIVEAIISWQALASKKYQESVLLAEMRDSFSGYSVTPQHDLTAGLNVSSSGLEFKQQSAWQGVRLTRNHSGTNNPGSVCQFLGHGVIFSLLAPYDHWNDFCSEALKFWNKHCELGEPNEVSRLSVRFISQILINDINEVSDYIETVCQPASSLGLTANQYFHQDTIELTNVPYVIGTVRTVQPNTPDNKLKLIVDITVSTDSSFELQEVEDKLKDLRCLKNKMFFTLMKNAEQNFGDA